MKNLLLLFALFCLLNSCKTKTNNNETRITIYDNAELQEIYNQDQADRKAINIDWSVIGENDKKREKRIYELLDEGKVVTSVDYHNAAMVFQHGGTTKASAMAVKLMQKAVDLDPSIDKWLLAAAIDRDLMYNELPQIYGTQYTKDENDKWILYKLDSTKITDTERKEYRVQTLAEQRARVITMNKKRLAELYNSVESIQDMVDIIKKDMKNGNKSEYNVSETGINSFGYGLITDNKLEEALEIFILNTGSYPNAFNTWDSYGECLMKLNRTDEAIKAYQKSIDLNPENHGAKEMIEKMMAKKE